MATAALDSNLQGSVTRQLEHEAGNECQVGMIDLALEA